MTFFYQDNLAQQIDLPIGKVVCVGQNYVDHIKEMGSITNDNAVLFMKPNTALCDVEKPLIIPVEYGECHNEIEIAVLLKKPLKNATENEAACAIWGIGVGLDLTLRDLQKQQKTLGRPWEVAKSFDYSCPVSPFTPLSNISDLQQIEFSLTVNDMVRQQGNSQLMIRSITELLVIISQHFTLLPGDVVMTGTPAGVGPLVANDKLVLSLMGKQYVTSVANC